MAGLAWQGRRKAAELSTQLSAADATTGVCADVSDDMGSVCLGKNQPKSLESWNPFAWGLQRLVETSEYIFLIHRKRSWFMGRSSLGVACSCSQSKVN